MGACLVHFESQLHSDHVLDGLNGLYRSLQNERESTYVMNILEIARPSELYKKLLSPSEIFKESVLLAKAISADDFCGEGSCDNTVLTLIQGCRAFGAGIVILKTDRLLLLSAFPDSFTELIDIFVYHVFYCRNLFSREEALERCTTLFMKCRSKC
jgi:hypothetical protein